MDASVVKGYVIDESEFMLEGSQVKVVTVDGEVLEGKLLKPAKAEFRLYIDQMVRVLKVKEAVSIERI